MAGGPDSPQKQVGAMRCGRAGRQGCMFAGRMPERKWRASQAPSIANSATMIRPQHGWKEIQMLTLLDNRGCLHEMLSGRVCTHTAWVSLIQQAHKHKYASLPIKTHVPTCPTGVGTCCLSQCESEHVKLGSTPRVGGCWLAGCCPITLHPVADPCWSPTSTLSTIALPAHA